MGVARRLRWLWWIVLGLTMPLPSLQAQMEQPRIVAVMLASDSFWVKRPAEDAGATHAGSKRKPAAKTKASGPGSVAAAGLSIAKKSDSIAEELAGTKNVPWSIVLGLTL